MASSKRLVKSKSGLKIVSDRDTESLPWDLEEPAWVPDAEVLCCSDCQCKFDFLRRKHHCRRCGHIFCGKCCGLKVQFDRMGFVDPVRHCQKCAPITQKELVFFQQDLKVLQTGAPFYICERPNAGSGPHQDMTVNGSLYNCKVAANRRCLLFNLHESMIGSKEQEKAILPFDLVKIVTLDSHYEEGDKQGFPGSLTITARREPSEDVCLSLESPPEPSRQASVQWLASLQKAVQLMAH